MQDEITTRLARMVGIELVAAEGRRAARERPESWDAIDLAMRGSRRMEPAFDLEPRTGSPAVFFEAALAPR